MIDIPQSILDANELMEKTPEDIANPWPVLQVQKLLENEGEYDSQNDSQWRPKTSSIQFLFFLPKKVLLIYFFFLLFKVRAKSFSDASMKLPLEKFNMCIFPRISAKNFENTLYQDPFVLILDIRMKEDFDKQHIPASVHIGFPELPDTRAKRIECLFSFSSSPKTLKFC